MWCRRRPSNVSKADLRWNNVWHKGPLSWMTVQTLPSAKAKDTERIENDNHVLSASYVLFIKSHRGPLEAGQVVTRWGDTPLSGPLTLSKSFVHSDQEMHILSQHHTVYGQRACCCDSFVHISTVVVCFPLTTRPTWDRVKADVFSSVPCSVRIWWHCCVAPAFSHNRSLERLLLLRTQTVRLRRMHIKPSQTFPGRLGRWRLCEFK